MKYSAIVLAAGSGKRMHAGLPKQYMDLCGKPLIYYALAAFEESPVDEIVLVVNPGHIDYCQREIVERFGFHKVDRIIEGGSERSESVRNGIEAAQGDYVLIHDGARPFLSQEVIGRMMDAVQKYRAAIAAVPEKNTIKEGDSDHWVTSTLDRSRLWEIQTPQAFDRQLISEAYQRLLSEDPDCSMASLTDDAMVVEEGGRMPDGSHPRIQLIQGDYFNIKITTPEDLVFGEAILKQEKGK